VVLDPHQSAEQRQFVNERHPMSRPSNQEVGYDLSIVGTVGLPASYGGFETLAEQLTVRLASRYRMLVFCTSKGRVDFRRNHLGADLDYVKLDANGWQSIPYDFVALWRAARQSKVILVLGVSGCLLLPLVRMRAPSTRIVTNIDGLEWKRRKWGFLARAVLRLSERFAVWFSHAVIADNQGIRNHVLQSYGRESALIAYGGDANAPATTTTTTTSATSDTRFERGTYFLAICRIEPENNIAEILEAFRAVTSPRIVIVGNWEISPYASTLRSRYSEHCNIEFLDPIYDRDRLDALRRCARAYVHGHSAGGTNPSLVEAMSVGMAVLAFGVDYNRFTTDERAAYWSDSEDLAHLATTVTNEQLAANAFAMRECAQFRYTWHKIASEYEAVLFPNSRDMTCKSI